MITALNSRSRASRRKAVDIRRRAPVFDWITCRNPSFSSLNSMDAMSSRRWPVNTASSIARCSQGDFASA
ncbi:hypothetical protein FQZ97_1194610 [compost metagenome]